HHQTTRFRVGPVTTTSVLLHKGRSVGRLHYSLSSRSKSSRRAANSTRSERLSRGMQSFFQHPAEDRREDPASHRVRLGLFREKCYIKTSRRDSSARVRVSKGGLWPAPP